MLNTSEKTGCTINKVLQNDRRQYGRSFISTKSNRGPNTEIKKKKWKIVPFRKLTAKSFCFVSVWKPFATNGPWNPKTGTAESRPKPAPITLFN